jgi:methylmalonyl-CoA mutase cobalamin-binding subunit
MHVHPSDVIARQDEDHDTELTRLAESAVEKGVNEITGGVISRDADFKTKKDKTEAAVNRQKNDARKKKKSQRQNRKKGRK